MSLKTGPPIIKRKSIPLIGKSAESFQIGPLSPSLSDSLTNGTDIPPPPLPLQQQSSTEPLGENKMMRPGTPQRAGGRGGRGGSGTPGSSSRPQSPAAEPSMPGAFVDDKDERLRPGSSRIVTPQTPKLQKLGYEVSATASSSPYAPSASSQPLSAAEKKSPKRPGSSIFRLLPFKRTFNDRASSSAGSVSTRGPRPQTPGADTSSIVPSLADSGTGGVPAGSLSKKKSGTFWGRRKSSLSLVVGVDEMGQMVQQPEYQQHQQEEVGRRVASSGSGLGDQDEGEEFPPRLKKKKSGTFWRRRGSMGFDTLANQQQARQIQDQSTKNMQIQIPESMNGQLRGYQNAAGVDTEMGQVASPDSVPLRPRSPPPQLPEVEYVLNGGGLMGEEDWFAHIG
ncbi:MAG: hypothetical protein LQ351_004114 [Letrouitia transgressa]|nr:MAG: hypothetical protein LQ351_004114 [Letrouitia transgressa]